MQGTDASDRSAPTRTRAHQARRTHSNIPGYQLMKKRLLFVALAAIPLVSAAADPVSQQQTSNAAATPQISQERLARIRQHLLAQIAAYEPAEGAMRAPTAQEAAALVIPSGNGPATVVRLPSGGVAMQGDVSNASLAVAVKGADGKVSVSHDDKPRAAVTKGGAHVQ